MSCVIRIIVALCIAKLMIVPVRAAAIRYEAGDGMNFIYIVGEIVQGDADRFERIYPSVEGPTFVFLNSNGGKVIEGLILGEAIRAKRYATAVVNGSECASTCGLIWLAGVTRYVGKSGNIGFHAAYTGNGDDAKETEAGNAMVGAYLTKLGLSYDAVLFATSAPPGEIKWLHPADAQRIGIQAVTLPDPDRVPEPSRPTHAPAVAEALPSSSPSERRIMSLILSYYAFWSTPGTDVDGLAPYYGDSVTFYGSSISRTKVLEEKKKFATRWPTRHFTVRLSTLFAQCSDTCSVTGVVEWDVSSLARGAHSVGAANFVLRITPNGSGLGGVIVSENGSVLSNHTDDLSSVPQASAPPAQPVPSTLVSNTSSTTMSPEQQTASSTAAYAEGRQARIDYERWSTSLPEGPYHDGVLFWASNRSLKAPPSCTQPGNAQEWQQGCAASRTRLAISDPRRKAEKDYWWGWNSL